MEKAQSPAVKLKNYFAYFSEKSPTSFSKIVQSICAFGIYFAILGLCWSVPFPYFKFLGKYNSYFNWASFFIAFSIFYYVRLSPVLSYIMLFLTLIFAYIVTLIGNPQLYSGLVTGQVYFFIIFVCGAARYFTYRSVGKISTLKMETVFIWIGPIWAIHFLLSNRVVKN